MITEVKERRAISQRDIDFEYDGKWVVFKSNPSPSGGMGYVVAYGDGSDQDRDALLQIVLDRYDGKALLTHGHTPREDVVLGIYEL